MLLDIFFLVANFWKAFQGVKMHALSQVNIL